MNKQTIKEILNLLIKACLVFIMLFYPIGIIHESGHYLVGYNSNCVWNYISMKVTCKPEPQPLWLYFSLGGIFGILASMSLLTIKKLRTVDWIFIGIILMVFDQLAKMLFETFAHQAYLNNVSFWYIGCLDFIVLLTLILYYQKRNTRLASA